jgi:hypothetical protein
MKAENISLLAIFFAVSILYSANVQLKADEVVIYSNSFESSDDTIGWHVNADIQFHLEAPPNGGEQSLYVSGGCIVPHFWTELGPFEKDIFLLLRCWGKNLGIGGGVSIEVEGDYPRAASHIYINQKEWTYYESKDTLFCPAGKEIILSMVSGGFVSSAMLVDLVEIINVDVLTSVGEQRNNLMPQTINLLQNYPNPFNPVTRIKYIIPSDVRRESSNVTLRVYDVLGKEIAILVNEEQSAGEYEVEFNASKYNLTSGIYLYILKTEEKTFGNKMCLIQ